MTPIDDVIILTRGVDIHVDVLMALGDGGHIGVEFVTLTRNTLLVLH